MERALAARSTCIVAVGPRQKEEMLGYRLCPVRKIAVVPYGISLDEFVPAYREDGVFRRELGFGPDEPLVGIIGRLAPIKGHRVFLEAARSVLDRLPRVRFVVVGDGELRRDLEDRTQHLGLEHAVRFVGYRRDIPRICASLDIVALSSWHEGLPIALIEALAAGCYVVATDVGSVRDLIPDDRLGRLVPSGDPQALGDAIRAAVENRGAMSEEERRETMHPYGIDHAVENMDRLYRRLLKECIR
jgi:glycosyltransferase involved in cell wall biosynthesis